jgi:hypothetical protein
MIFLIGRRQARLPGQAAATVLAHAADQDSEWHRAAALARVRLVHQGRPAAAVAGDAQEPRRERPERLLQRLLRRGQRLGAVAAPVAFGRWPEAGHGRTRRPWQYGSIRGRAMTTPWGPSMRCTTCCWRMRSQAASSASPRDRQRSRCCRSSCACCQTTTQSSEPLTAACRSPGAPTRATTHRRHHRAAEVPRVCRAAGRAVGS